MIRPFVDVDTYYVDTVDYFYLFIILFGYFYDEYYVNFHTRSHLILCFKSTQHVHFFSEQYLIFSSISLNINTR